MLDQRAIEIRDIMSTKVIQFGEDDTAAFAIKMLERCRISGAPVINKDGKYVGVLSKTDLLCTRLIRHMEARNSLDSLCVKEIMHVAPLITVDEHHPVERTAKIMLDKHIHRVFVKNRQGQIIGIVTSFDILKFFKTNGPGDNRNIEMKLLLEEHRKKYRSATQRLWT